MTYSFRICIETRHKLPTKWTTHDNFFPQKMLETLPCEDVKNIKSVISNKPLAEHITLNSIF